MLNHCCYWHIVTGEATSNVTSKRVAIPADQLLTPQSLLELLECEKQRRIAPWQ